MSRFRLAVSAETVFLELVAERLDCPRLNVHGTGEIRYPAVAAAAVPGAFTLV